MSGAPKKTCGYCGCELALGAIACFRCGRLLVVERDGGTGEGTDGAVSPTSLNTRARAGLLEERWLLKSPVGIAPGATLWLAHDTSLDRPVTVKLLNEELAGDEQAVTRFEREARLLARLDHKNIALALSTGRQNGLPFLVMKQLKGRSLAEVLHARGGGLSAQQAAAVGAELCEGVQALHEAGVMLSNLQPRQVQLTDAGEVVLIDLGSARQRGDDLTVTAEVLAEAGYRAPEVLAGEEPDARSDVYSLGCMLYEMLTGRPPFEGQLWDVLAVGSRLTPPPSLSERVPTLPPGLAKRVVDAMAEAPSARPESAAALGSQLLAFAPRGAPLIPVSVPASEVTATEAVTHPTLASDVTPAAPREAVTAKAAALSSPGLDVPWADETQEAPREQASEPTRSLTAPSPVSGLFEASSGPTDAFTVPPATALTESPTRALPNVYSAPALPRLDDGQTLETRQREAVTTARPYLQQPSGKRTLLYGALVASLVALTGVVVLASGESEPSPPVPIPRAELKVAPVAPPPPPSKALTLDDVVPPSGQELTHRREELKTVREGHESTALARPHLRSGPAVTPWKVLRRGRKPVDAAAQATVVFVALFKGKPVPAQLEVDGVWRGVTPVDVKLAPGDHAVKLDHPGSLLTEVMLGFSRGETVRLEIELRTREQARARPPLPPGAKAE
ncbi:MAG: protein kinase [Archangiaceae bacterium]|nr:protein kinase [Archangiaceae bacterium]